MPVSCHNPHLDFWRARRKPTPVHRQPVSLHEVEKHCRIAACGDEAAGWRFGLEAIFLEMFSAVDAADAILPIQNHGCAAVRFEHRRRAGKLFECAPGFLTTGAIANGACDWSSDCFVFHAATSASRFHDVHRSILPRGTPLSKVPEFPAKSASSKFLNYAPASSARLLLRGPLPDGHIGRQWKLCIDLQDHARKRSYS